MQNMHKLKLLLTVPLAALFITGCQTGPGSTQPVLDPVAAAAIRTTLAVSVPLVTARDTNAAPYFQAVAAVFTAAAQNGTYDPAALQTTLSTISVKELHSATAQQVVTTAFAAYKAIAAPLIASKVDRFTYGPLILSVVQSMADGINDGLGVKLSLAPPQ
jgi:hypothetical protein